MLVKQATLGSDCVFAISEPTGAGVLSEQVQIGFGNRPVLFFQDGQCRLVGFPAFGLREFNGGKFFQMDARKTASKSRFSRPISSGPL